MLSSLKKIIICVLLAAGVLFIIELGCRFLEPGPIRFADEWPYTSDQELGPLHQPGFEGSWDGSHFEINSLGFRGPEPKDPSTPKLYRVLCLGSSWTYGAGVDIEDTWARLLELQLAARMPEREVEVLNFGVRGWGSEQYLEAWRRYGVDLVPDLVILEWSLADLPGMSELLSPLPPDSPPSSAGLFEQLKRTAVARHFGAEWRHRGRKERWEELIAAVSVDLEPWRTEGRAALRAELEELCLELRAKGARPVLLCAPFEFQVRKESADRSPESALGMISSGLDLPYFPARPTLRQYLSERASLKPSVFLRGDLYHLNATGHELVSEDLYLALERSGLLPD